MAAISMRSTEYLYGRTADQLTPMTEGLVCRIKAAQNLIAELLSVPLEHRDWERVREVEKAIDHNEALLSQSV